MAKSRFDEVRERDFAGRKVKSRTIAGPHLFANAAGLATPTSSMVHKQNAPETPATVFLRQHGVTYTEHLYDYVEHGGTSVSSSRLSVDEHQVVKTLVMQDQDTHPLIVLMHGDRKVSLKNLARQIGAKSVEPCRPEAAQRHSGYQVGGTSPFGTRKAIPIYVERSVLSLPKIYINGGNRGFLVGIDPKVLTDILSAKPVDCALAE
jgi:Cys-tRNA(Pro) deacylase